MSVPRVRRASVPARIVRCAVVAVRHAVMIAIVIAHGAAVTVVTVVAVVGVVCAGAVGDAASQEGCGGQGNEPLFHGGLLSRPLDGRSCLYPVGVRRARRQEKAKMPASLVRPGGLSRAPLSPNAGA